MNLKFKNRCGIKKSFIWFLPYDNNKCNFVYKIQAPQAKRDKIEMEEKGV